MSSVNVHCPYCSTGQAVDTHGDFRPFYVNCADCSRRFIVEPVESGVVVYRDGEAPCCSDPECRATEMGASGNE
ncbi:hypothetical protein [Pseudodesulfovibrio sp.]|uniref:hypothetical protein n=1 Tax=Pseudodesulfovibrio sp. TaxID=2035812 RepID=UPI0026054C52|nr:hypothetical protein [Pseudodesulfovibrio sp.]MDD3310571.1 hypothetical protein [Pseudodesulfovibrio sp.]